MKNLIRHIRSARAAFTLMEVNLAIFIMAVGVLAMTSLYPLGFRESEQSRDDVQAAVTADEVLGQLTAALSSRNITWQTWRDEVRKAVDASKNGNQEGWLAYFNKHGSESYIPLNMQDANNRARDVFEALARACKGDNASPAPPKWKPDSKYAHGLVVQWGKRIVAMGNNRDRGRAVDDYSRVSISFRMSRRSGTLMAAPIYYTEVHFQGDQEDMEQ